jgi:hypothetical protein
MEDKEFKVRVEDLPLLAEGLRELYKDRCRTKRASEGYGWDLGDEKDLQQITELGRRINRRIELAKISEACG